MVVQTCALDRRTTIWFLSSFVFSCSYTGREYITRSDLGELRVDYQFTVQIVQEINTVSDSLSRQTATWFFKKYQFSGRHLPKVSTCLDSEDNCSERIRWPMKKSCLAVKLCQCENSHLLRKSNSMYHFETSDITFRH